MQKVSNLMWSNLSVFVFILHDFGIMSQNSRLWHCHKLQCSSQIGLGSGIAMAMVGSCTSHSVPNELPYAGGVAIKRKKEREQKELFAFSYILKVFF